MLPLFGFGQPELEIQRLAPPRYLEFSPDGSHLWYKPGAQWWDISVAPNATAKHSTHQAPPPGLTAGESMVATHRSPDEVSPDGKFIAYLGAERPYGQSLIFVRTRESGDGKAVRDWLGSYDGQILSTLSDFFRVSLPRAVPPKRG